jgi:vacuolar protein sorting-associated protein 16
MFVNSFRKFPVSPDHSSVADANMQDPTLDTFRLGSTSPASVLIDAVEQLDRKSPKADDDIQLIKQHLDEAVDVCIRAAGHEFSVHWQKQLLKASSFGKSVLDFYNSDDFVDMTETLRVLNSVRFYETGLPLSYDQYIRLTPERLVHRLMNRNEYLLALKISDYLRLPTDRIYVHWACQKVRVSSDPEEMISRGIVARLNGRKGVSFEEIARAAFDEGRSKLATELLNYEPRAGKQVPLLMNMNEEVVALDKAIESGDTDLIMYVLLALKKKMPLATFFRTINTRPTATALVESTALGTDQTMLKDLYYQDDRRLDGANLLFSQALDSTTFTAKSDKLKNAAKLLSDSKDNTFVSKSIDETARLLKAQEALDKDILQVGGTPTSPSASPNETFVGLSLNETIFKVIRQSGQHKRAARLATDFRVPDKIYWWIRLRALVARRDWTEIEGIGTSNRKSPIGWEPFFEAILAAGNARVAASFIPRCGVNLAAAQAVKARVEMYVKCGLIDKAAEEAGNGKDMEALEGLRSKATGERDAQEVERWIGIVGKKPSARGRGFL